jgi:uncharacterized membrane protein YgcG
MYKFCLLIVNKRPLLILICLAVLGLILLRPATGTAQGTDTLTVIDAANLFENHLEEVETAANELKALGADVRVRTILTYGGAGSLDEYELQLEKISPSWTGQNGNIKSDLMVFLVSYQERETGLYFGNDWESLLGSRWESIVEDTVNPRFSAGDFAGGTVKGLEEIQRLIRQSQQTPEGNQPSTNTQWWIVPVTILVIIGLIIGVVLLLYLRNTRAKISAARQKAILAKQGAAAGINELLEVVKMLEIKVNVTAAKITTAEAVPLQQGVIKAKTLVDRSSEAYSNLAHSAGDPENPKLREVELGTIETEYKKILDDLSTSRDSVKEVETEVTVVQEAVDSFGGEAEKIESEISTIISKQDELVKAGYRTNTLAELIQIVRNTLAQARTMVSEKRILEGSRKLALSKEQLDNAAREAEEIPKRKKTTEEAITQLASRIEQVKITIENGIDNFKRVAVNYSDTAWEPIRGNGTEAENRVTWTIEALADAKELAASEVQEWQKAAELVESGNKWLSEAQSLIDSISILEANLIRARQDIPGEINAAQADITKAWEYIKRYDDDIREILEDELKAAEDNNNLAKEELNKSRPDYLAACKLAKEANEAADRILLQARNEHEAAERLRNQVVSTARDASVRVSITRKYIEDHHEVVQTGARNSLINAEEALRQADAVVEVNEKISLATRAESLANEAYSLAQNDVNNSWQKPSQTYRSSGTGLPPIIIPNLPRPTTGQTSGGNTSWGTPRPYRPGSSGTARTGGGSSSWRPSSGAGRRGGGARGW